jgi:hypothetical protein
MFLDLPIELRQEVAFQGGACSLFAYIVLVRATTTCKALHAAVAAARDRVVAHFNARLLLPPAYLYGEYGALARTWSVGVNDSKGVDHPINRGQKLTFEVHAVDDVGTTNSLCILVVLKVRIVFAPVFGWGATFELDLALNFFDVAFSLCAALGWPNGTLQAEHVKSEAKKLRFLQALRKDVFDRRRANQPRKLSINWRHPRSKLVVRLPRVSTIHTENPELVEYTGTLQENNDFFVEAMRAVHDFTDPSGFRGREFDPKPHAWLQIRGLNALHMYDSITVRQLYLDGTPRITNYLLPDEGHARIQAVLERHLKLDTYVANVNGPNFLAFQPLAFETDGEINDKASGLHLMHTFGYLEHRESHRAEVNRLRRLEAAAAATLTPRESRPKRAAAAAAAQKAERHIKILSDGERQDEDPDGGDLVPAW